MKTRNCLNALSCTLSGLLLLALAAVTGCNTQSGTDSFRNVDVDFTGLYSGTDLKLVSQNSGNEILTMNLSQSGSRLEAFDNNGIIFRGNIGRVSADGAASFTLRGVSTAGQEATINGTLSGTGSEGRMAGTWIENDLFGVVSGTASIAEIVEETDTGGDGGDGGTGGLTISPGGTQTLTPGQARTFSVTGGSAQTTWTLSNSQVGRLSGTTGNQVSYTATAAGSQTLTARSGTESGTVTITQTATGLNTGGLNTGGLNTGGLNTGGLGVEGLFSEGDAAETTGQ